MKITTIKSGESYRVVRKDKPTITMMLDGNYVHIFTAKTNEGLWKLERFGGQLNPDGIRKFMSDMGIQ